MLSKRRRSDTAGPKTLHSPLVLFTAAGTGSQCTPLPNTTLIPSLPVPAGQCHVYHVIHRVDLLELRDFRFARALQVIQGHFLMVANLGKLVSGILYEIPGFTPTPQIRPSIWTGAVCCKPIGPTPDGVYSIIRPVHFAAPPRRYETAKSTFPPFPAVIGRIEFPLAAPAIPAKAVISLAHSMLALIPPAPCPALLPVSGHRARSLH